MSTKKDSQPWNCIARFKAENATETGSYRHQQNYYLSENNIFCYMRKTFNQGFQICKMKTWIPKTRLKGHFPWYLTGPVPRTSLSFSVLSIQWYLQSLWQSHCFHCRYSGSCMYHGPLRETPSDENPQCLKHLSFTHPVFLHSSTQTLRSESRSINTQDIKPTNKL